MKRFRGAAIAALAAGWCLALGCSSSAQHQSGNNIVEEHLGPWHHNQSFTVISQDGCHVAYAVARGNKWRAVVDGKEGPPYDEIDKRSLMFSPDGKRVAYLAKKGEKWLEVLDGREGPLYDEMPGSPIFRADGTLEHLAVKDGVLLRVKQVP